MRKLLTLKRKGNITSLIYGQLFMLLLIIWCLFTFRLNMLNTTFYYIDDALTSSLLGAALVNTEEYGKSNQLIIFNNDEYRETTAWTSFEAGILLSEMNYGSDIILKSDSLDKKEILDITNRGHNAVANVTLSDEYLRQSLSAFIGNMNYNLSNGNYTSPVNVASSSNWLSTVAFDTTHDSLIISADVLKHSFLGAYIVDLADNPGTIEVTRFDIYNVYRQNLAERHIYMSEYMTYSKELSDINNVNVTGWKSDEPGYNTTSQSVAEKQFENKYKPFKVLTKGGTSGVGESWRDINKDYDDYSEHLTDDENESYASDLQAYERKKIKWLIDWKIFVSAGGDMSKLVCFTDARRTYQGNYNETETPYKYFYTINGTSLTNSGDTSKADLISDKALTPSAADMAAGVTVGKAPVSGIGSFSYQKGQATSYKYTVKDTNTHDKIVLPAGTKMEGTEIENTSLYAEITFNIKIFPQMKTLQLSNFFTNSQEVTVARLLDIELNDDK